MGRMRRQSGAPDEGDDELSSLKFKDLLVFAYVAAGSDHRSRARWLERCACDRGGVSIWRSAALTRGTDRAPAGRVAGTERPRP